MAERKGPYRGGIGDKVGQHWVTPGLRGTAGSKFCVLPGGETTMRVSEHSGGCKCRNPSARRPWDLHSLIYNTRRARCSGAPCQQSDSAILENAICRKDGGTDRN